MKIILEFTGVEEANGALYGERYFEVLGDMKAYIDAQRGSVVDTQELRLKFKEICDLHGVPTT